VKSRSPQSASSAVYRTFATSLLFTAALTAGVNSNDFIFAENFSTDVATNWRTLEWDNTLGFISGGTTVSGGELVAAIPSSPNGLARVVVADKTKFDIGQAVGTGLKYGGDLLGNLSSKYSDSYISVKWKIAVTEGSTPMATGTPFIRSGAGAPFQGQTFADPNGDYHVNPDDMRFSVYMRGGTVASGDTATGQSVRWFNEGMQNRRLLGDYGQDPAGNALTPMLNNTYYTWNIPLNDASAWTNYWGYGGLTGTGPSGTFNGPWSGPSGTGLSNYQLTLSDLAYLSLQIQSGIGSSGDGIAMNTGFTGNLVIDSIGVVPEPSTFVLLAIGGGCYSVSRHRLRKVSRVLTCPS